MELTFLIICGVAFLASALTFFSGFGLGTLLLPAFAVFFPVEQAIALTAIVHFLNGVFKVGLIGRNADNRVLIRFGIPAIVASAAGAALLIWLSGLEPLLRYSVLGYELMIMPIKLVVGLLLLLFSVLEMSERFRQVSFGPQYLPVGGLLSGFFGGLSGTQGALRSAFLVRAGLSKEAFIGTGVVLALMIDIARLALYSPSIVVESARAHVPLLAGAVVAAFVGAWLGNRYLKKVTMASIRSVVAVLLFVVAAGLMSGVI